MKSKHEKVKKRFYKKWWFWLIVVIVIVGAMGGNDTEDSSVENENKQIVSQNQSEEIIKETKEEKDIKDIEDIEENEQEQDEDVPTEYKSALNKAQTYSDTMYMSKAGL